MKYLFLLLSLFSTRIYGHGYDVYIPKPSGGILKSVTETSDGGFIVCGNISSPTQTTDFYFERYDSIGNLLWMRQFHPAIGGIDNAIANEIVVDNSGGFIFIGTLDPYAGSAMYVGKLDSAGNLINYVYDLGQVTATGDEIQKTSDGLYIVAYHEYIGAGHGQEITYKFDDSLNAIWWNFIGYGMQIEHGLATGLDNSIYLFLDSIGGISLPTSYMWAPTAYRLDPNGNRDWYFIYGDSAATTNPFDYNTVNSIAGTYDHGMLHFGRTYSGSNENVSVTFIDNTGDSLWNKSFGTNYAEQAFDAKQLSDSGYIVTGYSADNCFPSEKACMLLRLDKNADSLWMKTLPGTGSIGKTIQTTADNGYLIFCTKDSTYRVIKTDSLGNINPAYQIICNFSCPAYCSGDTAILTVTPPGVSYSWSNGETTQSISITSTDNYWIDVTDLNGIVHHCEFGLVNFIPASYTVFTDDTVRTCSNYLAQSQLNSIAISYQWFKNDTLIPSAITPNYNITSTGQFKLIFSGPCYSDSDSIYCIILPNIAPPTISPGGNQYICIGDSILLSTSNSYSHYEWMDLNFGIPLGNDSNIFYATQNGFYIVKVIDSLGCKAVSSHVIVNTTYSGSPHIQHSTSHMCPGGSGISAYICCSGAYATYNWSNGDAAWSISLTSPGTYFCIMNANMSCVAYSDTITITSDSVPPINLGNDTMICINDNFQLIAGPPSAGQLSYQWMDNSSLNTFTVNSSLNDTIEVSCTVHLNQCKNSDTVQVIIDNCLDAVNIELDNLRINPNPFNQGIFVDNVIERIQFLVFDLTGKTIAQGNLFNGSNKIDLSDLPEGIYVLQLKNSNKTIYKRIVKSAN